MSWEKIIDALRTMAPGEGRLQLGRGASRDPVLVRGGVSQDAFRAAHTGDFEAPIAAAHALGQLAAALLAIEEPREALLRLAVSESLLRNQNPSADRELPETQYYEGLVYLQLGKTHARLAASGGPSPRPEQRRFARHWMSKTIESMTRASVDTVHGGRARQRLRDAQRLLEQLQNPRRPDRITADSHHGAT